MESAHNRISELEASKSSIQPSKAQQGLYARNDEKLVLSGNIAKPNAPALPVSTTPAYGMGGLSGAGMGLAAIGVGVAGFGASVDCPCIMYPAFVSVQAQVALVIHICVWLYYSAGVI